MKNTKKLTFTFATLVASFGAIPASMVLSIPARAGEMYANNCTCHGYWSAPKGGTLECVCNSSDTDCDVKYETSGPCPK